MPGTEIPKMGPITQLVLQVLLLAAIVALGWLAKRFMDPLRRVVEGAPEERDVRQIITAVESKLESTSAAAELAARNAASGVQGVVQMQGELARLGLGLVQVQLDVGTLRDGQGEIRGELRATVERVTALEVGQAAHTDQLARVETIHAKRGCDSVLAEAAMASRRALAAGQGEEPRAGQLSEGSPGRPEPATVPRQPAPERAD